MITVRIWIEISAAYSLVLQPSHYPQRELVLYTGRPSVSYKYQPRHAMSRKTITIRTNYSVTIRGIRLRWVLDRRNLNDVFDSAADCQLVNSGCLAVDN